MLSVLLFVTVIFVVGLVLFAFTSGHVENVIEPPSNEPIALSIEKVDFNDTVITIYIRNSLTKPVHRGVVYVHNEPHPVFSEKNKVTIPKDSLGKVIILEECRPRARYEVRKVFNDGYTLYCMQRY